jgi:proteasome alpha subunit
MFRTPGGYDHGITVFSPDGRLFQVEYALETVKRGASVLGIVAVDGVVLAGEERPPSTLHDPSFAWKLFKIDDHLGAAVSGLSPDARVLVDRARVAAQSHHLTYDEPIDVATLARHIGDVYQMNTQRGGVRPFGVSIIFGGVDATGTRLVQTDPSGTCRGAKATALGVGEAALRERLEAEYAEDLSLDAATRLAIQCLAHTLEGEVTATRIRVAVIPLATRQFRTLSADDVERHLRAGS